MRVDEYGQFVYTESDICDILYTNPSLQISNILTESKIVFDEELELENVLNCIEYKVPSSSYDSDNQKNYYIPDKYKDFDIAKFVLDNCKTDEELQRAGEELLLFQQHDMLDLLVYLKYLVDTMRENNIVWGVGRGSSVASFVLFLIGVHKINSLYYDLPISEFIR